MQKWTVLLLFLIAGVGIGVVVSWGSSSGNATRIYWVPEDRQPSLTTSKLHDPRDYDNEGNEDNEDNKNNENNENSETASSGASEPDPFERLLSATTREQKSAAILALMDNPNEKQAVLDLLAVSDLLPKDSFATGFAASTLSRLLFRQLNNGNGSNVSMIRSKLSNGEYSPTATSAAVMAIATLPVEDVGWDLVEVYLTTTNVDVQAAVLYNIPQAKDGAGARAALINELGRTPVGNPRRWALSTLLGQFLLEENLSEPARQASSSALLEFATEVSDPSLYRLALQVLEKIDAASLVLLPAPVNPVLLEVYTSVVGSH